MTGAGNVVCDIDGVLYRGDEPIPGAGDALAEMTTAGRNILFVTNNATRTPSEVAAKVERLTGFSATPDQVVTSAQAAVYVLAGERPATLLLGAAGARPALEEAGIAVVEDWQAAGAVVVGLDLELSYPGLTRATLAVAAGARFIATNTDVTYPTPEGDWPGAGAIVAALSAAAGVEPEVVGKPHAPIRKLVAAKLVPGPTVVVGDRPETDLAMGASEGWRTVLVLTGVVAEPVGVRPQPDHVLESIAQLPALLATV